MTALYNNIIFGPIRSRRLGISLGVNLLPVESKLCSFDCIYCECGWNDEHPGKRRFNAREDVRDMLDAKLAEIENLVKADYTEESWQKLVDAKNAINALKSDRMAIEDDSTKALADLNAAIAGLAKAEEPTEAPNATEDNAGDTEPANASGCGSFVTASALVVTVVSVLGCAVVLKKKD